MIFSERKICATAEVIFLLPAAESRMANKANSPISIGKDYP